MRIQQRGPDVNTMRTQARAEQLLMSFYSIRLPAISTPCADSVHTHQPSVQLLHENSPWMLRKYEPVQVQGDGNCLFRAVSYALYSTEIHYCHLRLLSLIDVLLNGEIYDIASNAFYGPYAADPWLKLQDYDTFVHTLAEDGTYSDMLTVLAVSSVTQKAIQTVWPFGVVPGSQSPFTKFVMGRGVTSSRHPVYILWTTYNGEQINHFVPLMEKSVTHIECINVVDEAEIDSSERVTDMAQTEAARPETLPVTSNLSGTFLPMKQCITMQEHKNAAGLPDRITDMAQAEATRPETVTTSSNLSGTFLPMKQCINLLEQKNETVLLDIPLGPKHNCYFLINQTDNLERECRGEQRQFRDDCGAWESVRCTTYHYERETARQLLYRNGLYCLRKNIDGKASAVPLEPQPKSSDVITVRQYLSRLRRDTNYQRRVSSIAQDKTVALVEYIGKFPETVCSHGNSKSGGEYVRTHPHVMDTIQNVCASSKLKPKAIYSQLLESLKPDEQPRDLRQVQNVSLQQQKKL